MNFSTRRLIKNLKFYARQTIAVAMVIHGVITWAYMGYVLVGHVVHGIEVNEPGIYAAFWLLGMLEWMGGLIIFFTPRYSPKVRAMSKAVIDAENAARFTC